MEDGLISENYDDKFVSVNIAYKRVVANSTYFADFVIMLLVLLDFWDVRIANEKDKD